jgi:diadenosine tetraphosphate (Ap4A) HIT family hydrolase
MENCIFCKIIKGEFDSAKIWEDDNFIAILDICPNTRGMSLVLPKKHFDSYVFALPDNLYEKFLFAAKKVASILEKSLKVKKVAMVMEGMGVNHAHIKLYPMYGLGDEFKEIWAKGQVFFDKYPGYITTVLGPKANIEDLKKLAEEIKSKA